MLIFDQIFQNDCSIPSKVLPITIRTWNAMIHLFAAQPIIRIDKRLILIEQLIIHPFRFDFADGLP